MAEFSYRVRDFKGQVHTGFMEADHRSGVIENLRQQNYFIIEIKEKAQRSSNGFNLQSYLQPKVTGKDLALYCRQFATMVDAGLPLLSCLNILQQQSENKKMQQVTARVVDSLENGNTLADSFREHPKQFPAMFINMVEAGETGGVLDEVLDRLAVHFEKEHDLNEKVRSAMTYPVVIGIVAVLAVIFLLTFVLPTFTDMLEDMGVPLPLPTRIVIAVSSAFGNYWYLIFLTFGGLAYWGYRYIQTTDGRRRLDKLKLKLPIFGELQQKMIVSRFSRTLATLIKGGVPILQALEVVKKTSGNMIVVEGVDQAQNSIRDGQGMAEPLEKSGVFPPMVSQMIAVGEETGALDRLLEKISDFYDQEVNTMVSRLSSMIEPVLMVFMGVTVGFIVISMLLPMFSIVGNVG